MLNFIKRLWKKPVSPSPKSSTSTEELVPAPEPFDPNKYRFRNMLTLSRIIRDEFIVLVEFYSSQCGVSYKLPGVYVGKRDQTPFRGVRLQRRLDSEYSFTFNLNTLDHSEPIRVVKEKALTTYHVPLKHFGKVEVVTIKSEQAFYMLLDKQNRKVVENGEAYFLEREVCGPFFPTY